MSAFEAKKAHTIYELGPALSFETPVGKGHDFYTDFSGLRGTFAQRHVFKYFEVHKIEGKWVHNPKNIALQRKKFFLAGMKGSGKTSELLTYSQELETPDTFLCVTCNIDKELTVNSLEFMDILIFQTEKLTQKAQEKGIVLRPDFLESLYGWFGETVKEIEKKTEDKIAVEGGLEASFGAFLKLLVSIKASITGTDTRAEKVRSVFRNRFESFANKFNEFVGEVTLELRKQRIAKEILFIVDGLEKSTTYERQRKVVIDDANYMRKIDVNMIFTLPFGLVADQSAISNDIGSFKSFPLIKLREPDGEIIPEAMLRFKEFVYKRVDKSLFDHENTVERCIMLSGGAPRELLRILLQASLEMDGEKIDRASIDAAALQIGKEMTSRMTETQMQILEKLRHEPDLLYSDEMGQMLHRMMVYEYNDGSHKRVNPIIEESARYKKYIQQADNQ